MLRVGTLGLGAAEVGGASRLLHPAVVTAALAALAGQSAVVFGAAARRLRRRTTPALDGRTALVETVAGILGLLVVAYGTRPSLRASSTFWIEPYTVISSVTVAACARRASLGAAAVACLTATYLLSVLVLFQGEAKLSLPDRATALTNAVSYLPFFVVGAIGFSVVRSVIEHTDALRRLLGRLAAERARVGAATTAHQIGHDIPKALLREVRRGSLKAEEMRPWAERYRDDLRRALSGSERAPAELRDELAALAGAFAAAGSLRSDLDALGDMPSHAPMLLIAEAARELLNNAFYHAYGYPVTLTASSSAEQVEVAVHNDGPGVDRLMVASAWARKQNTVHQLEAAGGGYEIASAAGLLTGTTVTLTWPAASPDARGKSAPCGY